MDKISSTPSFWIFIGFLLSFSMVSVRCTVGEDLNLTTKNGSTTVSRRSIDVMTGKWELASSDKFEEYLSALGVGYFRRKLAASVHLETEIEEDGGNWTIKTTSRIQNIEIHFRLGVPFEESRIDGPKCKSVITVHESVETKSIRMIHHQDCDSPYLRENLVIRDFSGNKMILTLKAGPVVSKRVYNRILPVKRQALGFWAYFFNFFV